MGEQAIVSEDKQQPTRLRPAQPPEVVLATGTQANGELKAEGDVRVDGTFEGRIEVVGWVIVGEQAQVTADVVARHVLVDGRVHGSIQAVGQVQVSSTGQVWGDVDAAELIVDPGGEVHPAGEEPPLQPALPLMSTPVVEPKAPPVEVVWSDRRPARERLRRAEEQIRQQTLRRWVLSLGAVAAGILIVCGVLALSGLLPGAPSSPTPTRVASGPTAMPGIPWTPTRRPTNTPMPTSTSTATVSPTHTPSATPTPAPTVTPSLTKAPTSTSSVLQTPTAVATTTSTPALSPTSAPSPTEPPTNTPTESPTATPTATVMPATPTLTPTASPTGTVPVYPFMPDGPVVSEYPNCAPAVVWLRGEVRNATPEQLQHVQMRVRHPDDHVLTEPVQPNGSYEVRLYTQGPCPVTLVDSRDGTHLSPTVNIEYADTCNGSAFTLHWKRVEPPE